MRSCLLPPAYCLLLLSFLLMWGFDDEHGTAGVAHNCFSGRAENDPAKSRASVRRDHNQIDFAFCGDSDYFRGGVTVHDYLFEFYSSALFTFSQLWELPLSRVFQLIGDVRNRHRFS